MTTSTINGDDEGRKDQEAGGSTTPTTGFTAVNGKASPPAQAKSKSDQEPKKTPPEAASHRQLLPNTNEPPGPFQRDSRPSTTGHERRISPAPPSNPEARPTTNGHSQYGEGHSNGTSQPAPHAVMSPPMPRRKRSLSQERGPIYPGNGPPPSPGGHRMSIDNGSSRERDPYGHRHDYTPPHENYPPHEGYPPQHSYPPPPQDHPGPSPHDIYPRGDRHQMTRSEYDHPVDPSIVPGGPRPYYPDAHDAHLADALQRENRGYDGGPGSRSYHSPEDDDDQNGQYEDYGAGRDSNSMDPDRRKRKRVFSNRTKTGCMTCRRRKKKCDEMHPECRSYLDYLPDASPRTFADNFQVRIACAGALSARDTMHVTPGKSRLTRSSRFLYNRRMDTPFTQVLPIEHHINRLLATTPAPIILVLRLTIVNRMMVAVLGLDQKTIVTTFTEGLTYNPSLSLPGTKPLDRTPATHHKHPNMRADTSTVAQYMRCLLTAPTHMVCMPHHQTPAESQRCRNTPPLITARRHLTPTYRLPLRQLSLTQLRCVQQQYLVALIT